MKRAIAGTPLVLTLVATGAAAQFVPDNDVPKLLRDWPSLARYRDENAALAAPVRGQPRVVFLGDSITDNWGREVGTFFPDKPCIHRGISGQTTPQLLLRFRADVIALKPAVAVILAGTNDLSANTGPVTLAQTQGNLESMAKLARVHGIAVVLATLLPVSDAYVTQTASRPPERIMALNKWVRGYCERSGCTLLDYSPAMRDAQGALRTELTDDGLHPNAAGYAVMAPLAQAAVERALSPRQR